MVRLRICACDSNEINPISAALNFIAACLAISAIISEWLVIYNPSDLEGFGLSNTSLHFPFRFKHFPNGIKQELAIEQCISVSPRYFLLNAKFSTILKDGQRHMFYQYDNKVFMDCISPAVADCFYLITALCFVAMSMSTFAALLHSLSPPFMFFAYLRLMTLLEAVVCIIALLVSYTLSIARTEVLELQHNVQRNPTIVLSTGFYMIVASGMLSLCAAVLAQRRQSRIRQMRRLNNQQLMCNRSLRSWRDVSPRQQDPQPVVELERYLLEPGLRRHASIATVSSFVPDEMELTTDEIAETSATT